MGDSCLVLFDYGVVSRLSPAPDYAPSAADNTNAASTRASIKVEMSTNDGGVGNRDSVFMGNLDSVNDSVGRWR